MEKDSTAPADAQPPLPDKPILAPTPLSWRCGIALAIVVFAGLGYLLRAWIGPRGQAAIGVLCFIGITAVFSANLRAVSWRTIGWGFALQLLLGLFILKFGFTRTHDPETFRRMQAQHALAVFASAGSGPMQALPVVALHPEEKYFYRPGYEFFKAIAAVVKQFLEFTNEGSKFVFGKLADPAAMNEVFPENGFVFAFSALPTIIFVSSFFTILYYFGVLQFIVRIMARVMMVLMRTSGAETLSAAANVFMGQTEAPLIVKPYVERMTQSELLAMMVGGMATISGGVMAVYIAMGADPVAILATSAMAAPCGLYLSKLLLPEMEEPMTRGAIQTPVEVPHRNVIDAAAAGASDGLHLALNVAAMLIAFLALLAMIDYVLVKDFFLNDLNASIGQPIPGEVHFGLSLQRIFSWVFSPVAFLMGTEEADIQGVADLLGTKLVANEFVAYVKLTKDYKDVLSPRAFTLSTYALTGFANFASVGIQLGGIGAMAPSRRPDLARLGLRALLAGFLATLVNASIAGMLL